VARRAHEQRVGEQREREPQPLLLAAGALADEPVADVGDAGAFEHLGRGRECGKRVAVSFPSRPR